MQAQIQPAALQPASTWRRFFNLAIDELVDLVIYLVLIFILSVVGFQKLLAESFLARLVLSYVLIFLYYFVFEAAIQRTPGKLITGTRVVTTNGGKPTVGTIALRSLSRWVPFEPLSFYTGKDEDKKRTWWHDRWTHTRVIKT